MKCTWAKWLHTGGGVLISTRGWPAAPASAGAVRVRDKVRRDSSKALGISENPAPVRFFFPLAASRAPGLSLSSADSTLAELQREIRS